MWHSTPIEQATMKASTTLLSEVPIFRAVAGILFTALVAFTPIAQASSDYLGTWSGVYPSSTSDNNAGCALCHANTSGGSTWNDYGFAIRQKGSGIALATRITMVQSSNSDGNPATNLQEINANAQPGWTTGANNKTFNSSGLVTLAAAPAGIGLLDPTFTVGGNISGLTGSVTLQNNGGNNLVRTSGGAFTFATPLATGTAYAVTVRSQPAGQTCTVANGSGTIAAANVTSVAVTCVTNPAATKPDLNQHGLTGSWYEPATSGQGFEVEVFANPSAGAGSTFVSWFTYDAVIGGAERQRWYTAQGPVVTGQPNAALTIYRNTGGNFNAPPVTTAQVVGTATLSFDTCSSGQIAYAFTDGTGRTGTIPLTRLTQNVTCSTTTPYPTNADFALSGNWFDPATSGQGFTVEVNPNSGALFAAWYTYLPNGTASGADGQRWYTALGAFTAGMRSMPVTIYETTGGVFDTPPPPGQNTVPVGTGTMAFQSCSAATFSYNFTGGSSAGLSGTINLSRVGPLPPGCTT
jgi:hypothetical protein